MRFSTPYALAASMLVSEAVAVHAGHLHQKNHKRALVVVTDSQAVTESLTDTILEDANGNPYSTVEATVYATVDQGVVSTQAPAAAVTTEAAVATSVAPTTAAAVVTSAAAVNDAVDAGTVIVATYNGETFSWTTTFGAAATANAAAPAAESSAAASSAYVAPSSSSVYVAPTSSSVYVAPASSATTLATSYASSAAASSVYSSSAAAASTSSAASSSSTSTGPRGLSYNDASLTNAFEGSSEISWAYNWAQTSGDLTSGFEYVPMLWGLSDDITSTWDDAVQTAIAAGSTHLLAFNEPDLDAESDITAADAAAGYIKYMNPYSSQAKLGAPAVTNGGYPGGLNWLKDFLNDCNDECIIDFVPIHWYDTATNYVYFKDYVQEAYVAGGNRTLWITEMGATGTDDEQNTFLQVVLPWLDSLDYVERYSYFMVQDGSLVSGTSLSTIGSTFADFTASTISSLIADV